MLRRIKIALAITSAMLVAVISGIARADVIIDYTGSVDQYNYGPFTIGAPITGEIVLDSAVAPTPIGGGYAFYGVISAFSMNIAEPSGTLSYTGSGGQVKQYVGTTQFIELGLGGFYGGTLTGPVVSGFSPLRFHIDFRGDNLFVDPSVLATGLTETDFNYRYLSFTLSDGTNQSLMVERSLDTVNFSGPSPAVPIPGTLALFTLGLLGIAAGAQSKRYPNAAA